MSDQTTLAFPITQPAPTGSVDLRHGDCLTVLRELPDNSVDSVVTDPPYGLSNTKPAQVADVLAAWVTGDTEAVPAKKGGFMGADWDSFVPPPAVWAECLRVLKPGGHVAVFAGARTQDLMGLSIRLAGFEIRDTLGWIYGSGFPKSMDVSKAIDKIGARPKETVVKLKAELRQVFDASGMTLSELNNRCGFEASGYLRTSSTWAELFPLHEKWVVMREVIGSDTDFSDEFKAAEREVIGKKQWTNSANHFVPGEDHTQRVKLDITAPATSEAQLWDGWGTALKPAIEPIILARKPLDGTVAANVLAHGVGGLNIDGCRVPTSDRWKASGTQSAPGAALQGSADGSLNVSVSSTHEAGRFPANVLLDEHAAKEMDEQSGVSVSTAGRRSGTHFSAGNGGVPTPDRPRGGHTDSGGASRFFPVFKYQAKAPKKERPVIVREDSTKVQHPTVKPVALMSWLVTLITPEGGTTLDPFAGTGTTLQAARDKGFNTIGVEQDADYIQLIGERLGWSAA